ncbi:MAG: phosphoribosyl-ATP diphosphatase [Pseudomonadota bacterium]
MTAPLGDLTSLAAALSHLAATIDARAGGDRDSSYTAKLLHGGPVACAKKIAEEGGELALAIAAEGPLETASEAADLFYHILVGLRARGVSLDDVAAILAKRQGQSGLAEKAARSQTRQAPED